MKVNNLNFYISNREKEIYKNFSPVNIGFCSDKVDLKKNKSMNRKTALFSFVGACLPVFLLNAKKGNLSAFVNTFKDNAKFIDKVKSFSKMFDIDSFKGIFAAISGGIAGGLTFGILNSKSEKDKQEKLKEGLFEFLNTMVPTVLVATSEKILDKKNVKNPIIKIFTTLGSIAGGMFLANKTSNLLNDKVFDKNQKEKTVRKFKPADCLVHMDDLVGLLVISKVPFAKQLQIDKILPFLYAKAGYEAGSARHDIKKDGN